MKLENFTDLHTWAVKQWADVFSEDSRYTQRAIALCAAMTYNPQASLPDIMLDWNEIRAAYRLIQNADYDQDPIPTGTQTDESRKSSPW